MITTAVTKNRFQSELKRSTSYCSNKLNNIHISIQITPLPGTPPPIITYRQRLIDLYGITALPLLRHALYTTNTTSNNSNISSNSTVISVLEASQKLHKLVPLTSKYELHQILAYYTSSSTVNVDDVIRVILGRVEGFPESAVIAYFQRILSASGGDTRDSSDISLSNLYTYLNESDDNTIVYEQIKRVLPVYAIHTPSTVYNNDNNILMEGQNYDSSLLNIEGFVALHYDMFASVGAKFIEQLEGLWEVTDYGTP